MRVLVAELGAGLCCEACAAMRREADLDSVADIRAIHEALGAQAYDLLVVCAADHAPIDHLSRALQETGNRLLPLVALVPADLPEVHLAWLRSGADTVLPSDTPADELQAACEALVERSRMRRGTSPLTGLPGNELLHRAVADRLGERGQLAVLLFDLTDFKAYNDRYGYLRGDELLQWLAEVIRQTAGHAGEGALVAHIGGDDFAVVTSPPLAAEMAHAAIERYEADIGRFYDEEAQEAGGVWSWDRSGNRFFSPICRLVVALATNEAEDIQHPGQISQVLAELKRYGRTKGESVFVPDRRRDHSVGPRPALAQAGLRA